MEVSESSQDEGFSASEDEWKPSKRIQDGDTSDDDSIRSGANKTEETKSRSVGKQNGIRRGKVLNPTLRAKLYNIYKPLRTSRVYVNSPSSSCSKSKINSKTATVSNDDSDKNDNSSVSSVDNYLVNPSQLDLQSSFFDVGVKRAVTDKTPLFLESYASIHLSGPDSEDGSESSKSYKEISKAFDFGNLLHKATRLESLKESIAEKEKAVDKASQLYASAKTDIESLLALGENALNDDNKSGRQKLQHRKSSRKKRLPKNKLQLTSGSGADSDKSDWEEVSDNAENHKSSQIDHGLEIHVELPGKHCHPKHHKEQDVEAILRRKLNRNIKERQLMLHKTSLLCCFARGLLQNRLLNDTELLEKALKLLPSKNSYPTECGANIKYYQSLITWFKSTITLKTNNLYPDEQTTNGRTVNLKTRLKEQFKLREARCKMDVVFMFVILSRAMGFQSRLVINMQPLPLRPAQSDLCTINLKKNDYTEKGHNRAPKLPLQKEDRKASNNDAASKKQKVKRAKSEKEVKKTEKPNKKEEQRTKKKHQENCNEESNKREYMPNNKTKNEIPNKNNQKGPYSEESSKSKIYEDVSEPNEPFLGSQCINTKPSRSKITPQKKPSAIFQIKDKQRVSKHVNDETESKLVNTPIARRTRLCLEKQKKILCSGAIGIGSPIVPKAVVHGSTGECFGSNCTKKLKTQSFKNAHKSLSISSRRSKSPSPKLHISPQFLETKIFREKIHNNNKETLNSKNCLKSKCRSAKKTAKISPDVFSKNLPQLDGANDLDHNVVSLKQRLKKKRKGKESDQSDENDFEKSPLKKQKKAPILKQVKTLIKDRRVISSDDADNVGETKRNNSKAVDFWVEVWSEAEDQWICLDLFKGKLNSVDVIRKSATSNFAYVYAFQNDLSLKDVTARYCPNWTTMIRKSRVQKEWLDVAISKYVTQPTIRDIHENFELRRIHEQKPMPTTISELKDHPLYALERHLLKFQAIYPPDAPTLGFLRGEPVYSRDCVHVLHSREIWLKQARTVKMGEQPYKTVKARPKWDRVTQTVIKDQPLEVFGYWQTQDYEPPTAENGIVPRNAYGNVELFKTCMLPKKTVHLKLPGLNRICKKLNVDCANALVGFDFHQGACHPTYDGFVVCEEFVDQLTAAWYQDQKEQDRKEREKYEARVHGNWKKLVRLLLIRERLKKKYNY